MKRVERIFIGDFETTVYQKQEYTEVWASALVELYSDDVKIFNSIDDTFNYLTSLKSHITIYYHNLEFDGAFWLSFLRMKMNFSQAYRQAGDYKTIEFLNDNEMPNKSFKYLIDDMGKWYTLTFKINGYYITLKDSLKLLPFSVKRIGESFETKHKKLDMVYDGFRFAGCEITDEEKEYIKNDVLVVKEALEIMRDQGHKELTIGSCCLKEFKSQYRYGNHDEFRLYFPDLYSILLDEEIYGAKNADEYIRKSYKGGWCYLSPKKAHKIIENGCTYDVNSLYPFVMSEYAYPIGTPIFWQGDRIPVKDDDNGTYYFIRFKCEFDLKKDHLPCVQIKNSLRYMSNEWLTTSMIKNKKGEYKDKVYNLNGELEQTEVELTMTKTDFILFKDHYNIKNLKILDGCYFQTQEGLFNLYINKYKKIKMESTGAKRELAKLFLNNLYGKMASSTNSSFKFAYEKEDGTFAFLTVIQFEKQSGYIPIGSAITSYARNYTIRSAQKNFKHFIYADTDSIHCQGTPDDIKGIKVDNKEFGAWKLESVWDKGYFVRQKTYIEQTKDDYNIICAGMPDRCKNLLRRSLQGDENLDDLNDEQKSFVSVKRELPDFDYGLIVPSKLMKKQIKGGVVLYETNYEMRGKD